MYKHKIRNKYILDIFKKMAVTRGEKKCDKTRIFCLQMENEEDEGGVEDPAAQGAVGGADSNWARPYCFRKILASPVSLSEQSKKAVLSRYIPAQGVNTIYLFIYLHSTVFPTTHGKL